MAVRTDGDSWIMEQVGEKQDFESELTRLRLRHEDFELSVRRAALNGAPKEWSTNYAVRVRNAVTGRHHIYWGGPGQDWIAQFAEDLSAGMYGSFGPGGAPHRPETMAVDWTGLPLACPDARATPVDARRAWKRGVISLSQWTGTMGPSQ